MGKNSYNYHGFEISARRTEDSQGYLVLIEDMGVREVKALARDIITKEPEYRAGARQEDEMEADKQG